MPLAIDTNAGNPLIAANFSLEVQGVANAFFTRASGFNNNHEVVTHVMTDDKGKQVLHKVPGELSWDDITLERGITDNMDLWNWRQQVIDGKVNEARKDGSIVMYDQEGNEKARYNFLKGWPSGWTGADIAADGNEVVIESITIAHEGLVRVL